MGKLGLIAGGGGLPLAIAQACREAGRSLFVVRLKGMAGDALAGFEGADIGLAELGRCVRALRRAGCGSVCFAGLVRRPADFSALKPDLAALRHMPDIIAAARGGDDALLRAVLRVFEKEGFRIEGVGEAGAALLLGQGSLGARQPGEQDAADMDVALEAARRLGLTDAGQAAIARDGRVLALEDQGGTDTLLARCAAPADGAGRRSGVLAKAPKPRQDRRIDLPTIGVATLERAAAAGLAGVVGEAGAVLVVDKPAVRAAADRLGLFVAGVGAPS
jgi:DUF1009 family protein